MAETNIEWTEMTWNPVHGCKAISPGCANCYAEPMTARLEAMGQASYAGLTKPGKRARCPGTGWWVRLKDKKGGDLAELPADLRIREMPEVRR